MLKGCFPLARGWAGADQLTKQRIRNSVYSNNGCPNCKAQFNI